MTPTLRKHLIGLGDKGREKLRRDSVVALRKAWPHRHSSFRAPQVVRANVTMLRNLDAI